MANTPTSISDLIEQWPTIGEFAADIGCGYEAARQMRMRQSIAPEHWQKVVSAASSRGVEGVTFEWIAQQRAKRQEAAQ